ncbi:Ig-like domain-containing protein [Desulfococcus sp.]|uniref:Ig-like domain-containing protein n=1 Tax=Desulfococcus sp. TaxID=2025834 RepID=UPI003593953F
MNEENPDPGPPPVPVYNLTGTAYNPDGAPFSGVAISVFSPQYTATTDAAGRFLLEVSKTRHLVLASRAGYTDYYEPADLTTNMVDLPIVLQKSAIAGVNALATAETYLASNRIDGQRATLTIPVQSGGAFTVGNTGGLRGVDIVLENHDLSEPLSVPMPSPEIIDKPVIGGKQTPSVLVSVQPALLRISTPAVLTLPNPDNLKVTRVLRFDPESHQWKTIDAVTGTSVSISHGGVYGIFFEERRTASVRGTASAGTAVQVGDEMLVVGPEGSFYINEVPVPAGGSVNVIALAPAVEGTTVRSVTDLSLALNVGQETSLNLGSANIGTLSLRADRYTIESNNEGYSLVTATVVNSNNSPAVDAPVAFTTDGGMIVADGDPAATPVAPFNPSAVKTDAFGKASIRLKSGPDRSNRVITVTASAGDRSTKSVPIQVVGTTISLDNDNTSLDAEGLKKDNLVVTVQDANASPINDAEVTVSVSPEGSLIWHPSADLRTDVSGKLTLEITGRNAVENAVLRIEAAGDIKTQSYLVYTNAEFFTITSPTDDPYSWPTGRDLIVKVRAPQQDVVRFVTSFGQWRGSSTVSQKYIDVPVDPATDEVSAVISSAEAGIATVQVFDRNNPSISDTTQVAFASPSGEACRISLQASATVVAPSVGNILNSVELTAKVKNQFDQAVKNVPVVFFLNGMTTTGGGERLSPAIAYTDSQGFARSTFYSGTLGSDAEGVEVTAAILDSSTVDAICNQSSSIRIVIGGTAGSISIGQSTKIESINADTAYKLPMSVLVSDSNGNPMPNATVTLKLWPTRYATGYRGGRPECPVIYTGIFDNEDVNRSLMCDYCKPCPAGEGEKHPLNEDLNGDCELTPSSSSAGSLPGVVQTDENGVGEFALVYNKENAAWLEDEVVATAMVYGTETRATLTFWLPILEGDKCNLPGESPFNRTEVSDISLMADPESVVADGVSTSMIFASVKDVSGNPLIGGSINFDIVSGPGTLSARSVLVTDGVGTVYYTAPNGRGAGSTATIRASASNAGGQVSDQIDIRLVDAIVSKVDVTAGAQSIMVSGVGGINSTVIRAAVSTTSTRTVPDGTLVSFVTTAGMISNVTRTANGVATATLTSSTFAGTATVMAFVDGVSGSAQVEFIAGPPKQIRVSAPASMAADTTKSVSAFVTDSQGNPVTGSMMVNFSASSGSIAPATTNTSNGEARAEFTAPSIGGSIRITATASGGITGSTSILVTAAP